MASYLELYELYQGGTDAINDFHKKIVSAIFVAGETIRDEDVATANHANRLIWAKWAFTNPESAGRDMIGVMLGANSGVAQASILGASDTAIQSALDASIDLFADGTQGA